MIEPVTLQVRGEPVGKGRPRFTRAGHTYTPPKTTAAENLIRRAWLATGKPRPYFDRKAPVSVSVKAYFPIPASWTVRQKADAVAGIVFPTKKPDADNIQKLILDALNGFAYADDAQVVQCSISKEYAPNPEWVGYSIYIKEYAE